MEKIAVYPGSFDPITNGHVDIISRLSLVFDKVIILVSQASEKKYMFSTEERMSFIRKCFKDVRNIHVDFHQGLTVDYMKKNNAKIIVRGLRAVADFEYEGTLASMNKKLDSEIETFMIFSKPELYFISSRAVKEVAKHKGSLVGLVPDVVINDLQNKFKTEG